MTAVHWTAWLAVAVGGGGGACLRYAVTLWLPAPAAGLPLGTLLANGLGCLVAGAWLAIAVVRDGLPEPLHLFVMTGFLGAFTTFSAFSGETLALVRHGHAGWAFANAASNLFVSLACVAIGFWCVAGRGG